MGPLKGLKIVELAGIGPAPFGVMQLADMGATVIRIERLEAADLGVPKALKFNLLARNRQNIALDLKNPKAVELVLELIEQADVLVEGFRPGVTERMGLGPEVCLARNPKLVYGRMTGWGQTGPLAPTAGHDINYISLTGALAAIGPAERPVPPLNLVGDFGGGSMFLVLGILAALWERQRSGKGQVVDAAIVDGVTSLMTMFSGPMQAQSFSLDRDKNLLGGAAPFYRCYLCADEREIAIGSLEPHFYRELLERIGAPPELLSEQTDHNNWPERTQALARLFATRSSAEWCEILEGTDACFAPVLTLEEAPGHPQLAARASYVEHEGLLHAAPAPRFSRTPGSVRSTRSDGQDVVARWKRAPAGASVT